MLDFGAILRKAQEATKNRGPAGPSGPGQKNAHDFNMIGERQAGTTGQVQVVPLVPYGEPASPSGTTGTTEQVRVVPVDWGEIANLHQLLAKNGTTGTSGTIEKHEVCENQRGEAEHRVALRNSVALYVSQADPYRCHACGGRETSDRPLIPVLSAKPEHPHWLHRGECHDEHIRRIDEQVALALTSSVSVSS